MPSHPGGLLCNFPRSSPQLSSSAHSLCALRSCLLSCRSSGCQTCNAYRHVRQKSAVRGHASTAMRVASATPRRARAKGGNARESITNASNPSAKKTTVRAWLRAQKGLTSFSLLSRSGSSRMDRIMQDELRHSDDRHHLTEAGHAGVPPRLVRNFVGIFWG